MSLRQLVRPKALEDITAHALYISVDSQDEAERFLTDTGSSLRALAETPEIGSPSEFRSSALAGMRVWPIRDHPKHLLFYIPHADSLEIVRVLHTSRDHPTVLGG